MTGRLLKLYGKESDPAEVFLISKGTAYLYISNSDKYTLRGQNYIVGASEIVLSSVLGHSIARKETVLVDADSIVKKISIDKFREALANPSFVLNAAMVTARQVVLTNNILFANKKKAGGAARPVKDVCIDYYKIISAVSAEYDKRKLPWLKEILSKYQTSLTFKRGEIYFKSSQPYKIEASEDLTDKFTQFPKSTVIFSQGEDGRDMFILQSGSIDVLIGENRVAVIDEPGTPIGEIALLLGEKRSATLKAANNVIATKITQEDLKGFLKSGSGFIVEIVKSLSQKHLNNVESINTVNDDLISIELGFEDEKIQKAKQQEMHCRAELDSLKRTMSEVFFKKDSFFLKEKIKNLVD